MAPMTVRDRMILLGEIGAAHGIRGEVRLRSYTTEPAAIAQYGPLTDKSGSNVFVISAIRNTAKGLIARIAGVNDRTAAEQLRNTELYVPRSRLPEPESGTYYYEDLMGLAVVSPDGAHLGIVRAIANYGAGDLLEYEKHDQSETELVPFTSIFVPQVDLAHGRVVVAPPQYVEDDAPAARPGDEAGPPVKDLSEDQQ